MKNNMKILMCALAVVGISTVGAPVQSMQNMTHLLIETNATEARAFIYEWVYKVIDGHLYKRLYNATLGQYESDWILVQ